MPNQKRTKLSSMPEPTRDSSEDHRAQVLERTPVKGPKPILRNAEEQAEFNELLAQWRRHYDNPSPDQALSGLVLCLAEAEWNRRYVQTESDRNLQIYRNTSMIKWCEEDHRHYVRYERYVTAAERKFNRAYKMADSCYKTELAKQDRAEKRALAEAERKKRNAETADEERRDDAEIERRVKKSAEIVWVQNIETGEKWSICGKYHEPPVPGWVPQKITPGQYGPLDPSNIAQTIREQYFEEKRLRKQKEQDKESRAR